MKKYGLFPCHDTKTNLSFPTASAFSKALTPECPCVSLSTALLKSMQARTAFELSTYSFIQHTQNWRSHFYFVWVGVDGRDHFHRLTAYMSSEVDLTNVVVLQHCGVARVGCVVRSAVIERTPSRKGQARVQAVLFYELARTVFQLLTETRECVAFVCTM